MRLLLLAVILLFSGFAHGQKADSLHRSVDSTAKQLQNRYEALEDSLNRLRVQRSVNENGKALDQFLADYKEKKENQKQQTYIRVGLGLVFLAVVIYGFARKRKAKNSA